MRKSVYSFKDSAAVRCRHNWSRVAGGNVAKNSKARSLNCLEAEGGRSAITEAANIGVIGLVSGQGGEINGLDGGDSRAKGQRRW